MRLLNLRFLLTAVGWMMVAAGVCLSSTLAVRAAESRTEEIEWTWEVRPAEVDRKLPNVLLLGDSITRNYFPEVQRELNGVANVYLMATSASAGDPRLPAQIEAFAKAEAVEFKLVHFNNGMHGWAYSEGEYGNGFLEMVAAIRRMQPKAALICATTTPVRKDKLPGPTNARVDARNAVVSGALAGILVDDQHLLMMGHGDLYADDVHFNDAGAAIQGRQAAGLIRGLLK